jgi:F-type H+-transporting ATPase subunit b
MVSASIDGIALAAAPQAINVDFDATFLVQLILFVALTLVLKPLLFDPMLKLFEQREHLIDGVKAQARHIDEKSVGALKEYEAAMALARAAGNAERERARAAGIQREAEILSAVRESISKVGEEGTRAAQAEAQRARAALQLEATGLAHDLAGRVLGREVNS